MFGRKGKDARPVEERAAEAQEFVEHLVTVVTSAILQGTGDAKDEALKHISTDIRGASKDLLERALGSVIIAEATAQAEHIRGHVTAGLADLLSALRQDAATAPTDLLPDDEPAEAPQAADAAPAADEKVWDEDRR